MRSTLLKTRSKKSSLDLNILLTPPTQEGEIPQLHIRRGRQHVVIQALAETLFGVSGDGPDTLYETEEDTLVAVIALVEQPQYYYCGSSRGRFFYSAQE